MFFDICGINKMFNVIMENYISLLVGQITIFGIVLASFQFLCDHQKNDQQSIFYLGYNIFELELKDNVTILSFGKSKLFLFLILFEIISLPVVCVIYAIPKVVVNTMIIIDIVVIMLYFVVMFLLLFQIAKYVLGMNKTRNMISIRVVAKAYEKFLKENNFFHSREINSKNLLIISNKLAKVIVLDDNKNKEKQEQIYYDMIALEILERYYVRKLVLNKDNSATMRDKAKKVFNKYFEVDALLVMVKNYCEKIDENNIHSFTKLIINILLFDFYYSLDDFYSNSLKKRCCEIIDCLYQDNNTMSKKATIEYLFANMNNYENEMVEIFCHNKIKNLICKELYNCFEGKESFKNFISVYDIINKDHNLRDHLCVEISEKMVSYNLVDVKDLMGILEVNERFYIFSYLIISYSVYKFRYNWEYINTNNLKTLFSIYNLDKIDVGYVSERLMCSNISHRINNNVISQLVYYLENSLTNNLMLQIKEDKYFDLFYIVVIKCCVLEQGDYLDVFKSSFTIEELLSFLNKFSMHREVICNKNLSMFLYQLRKLIIPQLSKDEIQYQVFRSLRKMIILDFDLKKEYFNSKSIFLNSDDFGKYVLLKLDDDIAKWSEVENCIKHSFVKSNITSESYVEHLSAISSELGIPKALHQKGKMKKYLEIHFN
jgi:hypothetical protein